MQKKHAAGRKRARKDATGPGKRQEGMALPHLTFAPRCVVTDGTVYKETCAL